MTVGPGSGSAGGRRGYGAQSSPGYAVAASGRAQLRTATVDRDRVVDLLTKAFAEGRLTQEEHEARVGRAMSAATFADLDAVVADLPGDGPLTPPQTNQLAIASFVAGVGQVVFWILATIPAIILGHMARRQIRRTGEQGSGMALAGLILGWAGLALQVLLLVGFILFVAAIAHAVHQVPPPPAG
jgi:uncharacterized protein DUF4190/uncharacterized protein DUF1707